MGEDGAPASIHYLTGVWDSASDESASVIDSDLEARVAWMQSAVETGRSIRTRRGLALKAPLREAVLIHPSESVSSSALVARRALTALSAVVARELNVRRIIVSDDKAKYGVRLRARPNPASLGARVRDRYRAIASALAALSQEAIEDYLVVSRSFSYLT